MTKYLLKAGITFLCVILGYFFIMHGDIVLDSVRRSLLLCANGLIPSLFCFMVLTAFLSATEIGDLLSKLFYPVTFLLHLPKEAGIAVFMSLLGGYPIGTKIVHDLYKQKKITAPICQQLLLYCCCPAPSFVIITVGCTFLHNQVLGLLLYLSQVCSALVLGWITGIYYALRCPAERQRCKLPVSKHHDSYGAALVNSVAFSSTALVPMCGSVVFFGAISAILHEFPVLSQYSSILSAFLEITTGCVELSSSSSPFALSYLSFFLAFGGLSVLFQRMQLLEDIPYSVRIMFLGRVLHGALAAGFTNLFLHLIPLPLAVFGPDAVPVSIYDINTPLITLCLIGMCSICLSTFPLPSQNK